MALTESRLRQIIKEEARKMMESERTPRGLPTRRGEPRDMDPNRGLAYGRGDGGTRGDYPRGGEDEAPPRSRPAYGRGEFGGMFDDEESYEWGEGPSAREVSDYKVGDTVKSSDGRMGKVTDVSSWDLGVKITWEDGEKGEYDARFGPKKVRG